MQETHTISAGITISDLVLFRKSFKYLKLETLLSGCDAVPIKVTKTHELFLVAQVSHIFKAVLKNIKRCKSV